MSIEEVNSMEEFENDFTENDLLSRQKKVEESIDRLQWAIERYAKENKELMLMYLEDIRDNYKNL